MITVCDIMNFSVFLCVGQFRDDHMADFPDLILSGMATPDIARTGIPVESPCPVSMALRTKSIMGIPTKGTDVFLDIDIEELLMDFSYDLEQRQNEVDNILRLLMRHASHLKSLYKVNKNWSNIFDKNKISFAVVFIINENPDLYFFIHFHSRKFFFLSENKAYLQNLY